MGGTMAVGPWHPPAQPQHHAGPGSRQRGQQDSGKGLGTDGGSHRRTDIRGIFCFLQRQCPGARGRGRVLSVVPGKGLDSNFQPLPLPQPPGWAEGTGPSAGPGQVGS